MAIVIAAVIEGLGLVCSYVALGFWHHNTHTHRLAQYLVAWTEFYLSLILYAVYFMATMVMLLEMVHVILLFPVLAAVGVVSLALLDQLAQLRTPANKTVRPIVQKPNKKSKPETPDAGYALGNAILAYYHEHKHASMRQVASQVDCAVSTVNKHVRKLESAGYITRNGNGTEVNHAEV